MRRAAAPLLLAAALLAGCGADPPSGDGVGDGAKVVTYTVGGHDLVCLVAHYDGGGNGQASWGGPSCDWGRWRGERQ